MNGEMNKNKNINHYYRSNGITWYALQTIVLNATVVVNDTSNNYLEVDNKNATIYSKYVVAKIIDDFT